jgi:hypothetical protein
MLGCQVEHCLWSEPSIQMIVEEDRREAHLDILVVGSCARENRRAG